MSKVKCRNYKNLGSIKEIVNAENLAEGHEKYIIPENTDLCDHCIKYPDLILYRICFNCIK